MQREIFYEKYIKPHLKAIVKWCSEGATDVEISAKLGIHRTTLQKHRKIHPELLEAMNAAKERADMQVEAALFKRACGYEYDEITMKPAMEVVVDKLLKKAKQTRTRIFLEDLQEAFGEHRVETSRVKRHIAPDTYAAMAWLTNRRREEWKHRTEQSIRVSGEAAKLLDDAEKKMQDLEAREARKGRPLSIVNTQPENVSSARALNE